MDDLIPILTFLILTVFLKLISSRLKLSFKELMKNLSILAVLLILITFFFKDFSKIFALAVLTFGSVLSVRQMITYDVEILEMVLRIGVMVSFIFALITDSRIPTFILVFLSIPWMVYFLKYKRASERIYLCMERSAKVSKNGCGWSSKPVVIEGTFRRKMVMGARGVLIVTKRNKAIVKVRKSTHEKLGRPCLEDFARNLIDCLFE